MFKRFNDWSSNGKLLLIFHSLAADSDQEWNFIDGSISKAHQHSSGAAHGAESAIGKSVAGNTTKIHLLVDAFGLPTRFAVTGGQVHDCKLAPELISGLQNVEFIIADRGYDSESLRNLIKQIHAQPIIQRKSNSKTGNADIDWCLYKYRHLVEKCLPDLSILELSPQDMIS